MIRVYVVDIPSSHKMDIMLAVDEFGNPMEVKFREFESVSSESVLVDYAKEINRLFDRRGARKDTYIRKHQIDGFVKGIRFLTDKISFSINKSKN